MSNQKWQEGKTYRIKPDWVDAFIEAFTSNKKIAQLIGNSSFTVTQVSEHSGRVLRIAEWSEDLISLDYWFYADEIKYFDLVEHTEEKQEMAPAKTEQEIVLEWLDKLHYVMLNDDHIEDIRPCANALILSTTLSDIYGIEQIYDFIQMRYNQMMIAEVGRRKQELLDKKAKLELELAQINEQLGE